MISTLIEMFSYTFLLRAVVVGLLVSLCAALLGVNLVLKRYSMIGDGLSHVGFGTLAIATAMNAAPLAVSIPAVVLTAFLLLRISENSRIKGDAAIALISTSSLAVGVIVISLTTGMNTDVCNYMFGSILAMNKNDVTLSVILAVLVLTLFVLFYNKMFAVTFDENFSRAIGVQTGLYNMLIAFLTAITIVLGMRMMGALLISSLIIFPALTSMRLCKRFKSVTLCSAVVSVLCFFVGVVISYVYATPTGASVVLVNIGAFLLFWVVSLVSVKPAKGALGLLILVLFVPFLLIGCQGKPQPGQQAQADTPSSEAVSPLNEKTSTTFAFSQTDGEIIEVREKMFISQMNDIYLNKEDYLGKTIKYEGIFTGYEAPETGNIYYSVIRYGPGCCGTDGNSGMEVIWEKEYPAEDDWVEVTGTLEEYDEDGAGYLRLILTDLKVLETRGQEYLTQ